MSADNADGLSYCSISYALENPTPARKIRYAALEAAEEADPFIIPLSRARMPDKPQGPTPAPVDDLTVLEAVEKRLALMDGQRDVPPDRLEVLRDMVQDGLTRHECIERIIAFYTKRLPSSARNA